MGETLAPPSHAQSNSCDKRRQDLLAECCQVLYGHEAPLGHGGQEESFAVAGEELRKVRAVAAQESRGLLQYVDRFGK